MPHTPDEQKRALARVSRIKGQVDALERSLSSGTDCRQVLQQISAVRGAVNGLMATVLEGHLHASFVPVGDKADTQAASIDDVVSIVRSYLR